MTFESLRQACTAQASLDTPLGTMLIARTAQGLAGLWFDGQQHHPGPLDAPVQPDDPLLRRAAELLQRYFAGAPVAFDLPLDLQGTPFQQSVWRALLEIPPGGTSSYGAIARALGAPQAVRAVGAAIGRNPLSVIVPCHRVLGQDGSLTGYAGGLPRKQALLALEARAWQAERRAAPKPARIPVVHEVGHCVTHGDRTTYSSAEGLS